MLLYSSWAGLNLSSKCGARFAHMCSVYISCVVHERMQSTDTARERPGTHRAALLQGRQNMSRLLTYIVMTMYHDAPKLPHREQKFDCLSAGLSSAKSQIIKWGVISHDLGFETSRG